MNVTEYEGCRLFIDFHIYCLRAPVHWEPSQIKPRPTLLKAAAPPGYTVNMPPVLRITTPTHFQLRAGSLSGNALDSRSRTPAILTEVILDSPQHLQRIRGTSVGITTGYGLESRGSISGRDKFLLFTASRSVVVPIQAPIQWVSGLFPPVVDRPGREDDHSTPSEVKNPLLLCISSWRDA
jgi:hypothetical protein